MPAQTASAPGKIILFGEHAVVYNQPAIAVPVTAVSARASIFPLIGQDTPIIQIVAPDISLDCNLSSLPPEHFIRLLFDLLYKWVGLSSIPSMKIKITSNIPRSAGMGSSAAVTVAITRAVTGFCGIKLPNERINQIAFEIEKTHHGNPSGIDNTVITYAKPVYFVRGNPLEFLEINEPFFLVIGNSGHEASTREIVEGVRRRYEVNQELYASFFRDVGDIAVKARKILETGQSFSLGQLMTHNHNFLQKMGVSTPQLDRLVEAAIKAGAWGAKLSGSGGGGNMIALVDQALLPEVEAALESAGATQVITTIIGQNDPIYSVA